MSAPRTPRHRIELPTSPKGFYPVLKRWRNMVNQMNPPPAALRVLPYLEDNLNREFGYAWVSDKSIATDTTKSEKSIGRGWKWLDDVGVIDRETRTRWTPTGEVDGSDRRIFLTVPERTFSGDLPIKMSARDESEKSPETFERTPTGHYRQDNEKSPEMLGRTTGVRLLYTDSNYKNITTEVVEDRVRGVGDVPKPFVLPSGEADIEFINAFDRELAIAASGRAIANDDVESIAEEAFDTATHIGDFMPFDFQSVCRLQDGGRAKVWIIDRAAQVLQVAV